MNTVLDKAKELGQAIQESPEMKAYRQAEAQMLARDLLTRYMTYEQAKIVTLSEDVHQRTREQAEQIVAESRQIMEHDKDVVTFREAERKLNELIALVNNTILHFSGVVSKGGCDGCSGCNGK